ncbi:Unknown protein [Striga hermonthica]|uniref:Uncharacterized protein n=1 Tax=Striga hermonthica TaxID=68872 RepID=A0A9N7MJ50_STRHE|nr:Unknown protein [Striga hermonthica]
MPMDRSPHTPPQIDGPGVLSIECLTGSSKADEWTGDMLQTGDIVEELKIGGSVVRAPFKNGKSGVQRTLHSSFKQKKTSIRVRVRRGSGDLAELLACIVPGDQLVGKKQYVLRAIDDPNYAVGFVDRTESECLNLQSSRHSRMVSALERTPLLDGYVPYPWDRRMHEMLPVPSSSSFYSVLFLPKASNGVGTLYNDLEDTLARAHTWINASQASGVPTVLINIQTESLLTKVSGETASSTVNSGSLSDLSNLANTSLYGFEDYHGVDIGVVRGVRLWFSPLAGEIPLEIRIGEEDTKLGFAISRTEEGFIYISSVMQSSDDNHETPSSRSGLSQLYRQAWAASRLLVVSRVSSQKVVPWMVSSAGAVRCFDTVSLSRKLSLHRHTRIPILLHVLIWDKSVNYANAGSIRARAMSTEVHLASPAVNEIGRVMEGFDRVDEDERRTGDDHQLERDMAGELSFRFRDFGITDNWV